MVHEHQYSTRSKAKVSSHCDSSVDPSSSSVSSTNDPAPMASSIINIEPSNPLQHDQGNDQSNLYRRLRPSSDSHQPSPCQISKRFSMPFSNECHRLLQNEVDSLKSELQTLKTTSHPSCLLKVDPFDEIPDVPRSTDSFSQTTTNNSLIPSVQYVINIDPLQQMKDFVKPFHGKPEDDVVQWIETIRHFFDVVRLPANKDNLCFQYAPAVLKNDAYQWWTENRSLIDNWPSFQQLLLAQFNSRNEFLFEQQLNHRKQQRNESVIKYYYEMMALCRRCDPDMSDKQKIRKLMQGLRLSLYQEAVKLDYSSPKHFLETIQRLEHLEKLVELRQCSADESMINRSTDLPIYHSSIEPYSDMGRQPMRSSFSPHHIQPVRTSTPRADFDAYSPSDGNRDQPYPPSNRMNRSQLVPKSTLADDPQRTTNFQCYYCGKWGHYARNCYRQQNDSSFPSGSMQQKKP